MELLRQWEDVKTKTKRILELIETQKVYFYTVNEGNKEAARDLYNEEILEFSKLFYDVYHSMEDIKKAGYEEKFIYFPSRENCKVICMILVIRNALEKYRFPLYVKSSDILKNYHLYLKDLVELMSEKDIDEDMRYWAMHEFLKYPEVEYVVKIIL